MAASRRVQPPLSVHLPQPSSSPALLPDLPPISALFLIDFDVKAGYTIVWKQAVPGLELEGTVEYKSLPSGLHTVDDDLIYFVHEGGHAGLSAFINTWTEDEGARNARMIAVGVLVPLSYGRLGRAWRHAEALKDMAKRLSADGKETDSLEKYWEDYGARETTPVTAPEPFKESPLASPIVGFKPTPAKPAQGNNRNRLQSDGAALIPPGHRLSPFHPAWSLTKLLKTFGPLIFPIHRAALLRKRILISTHAPVHETCNFVYDISIIANIPLSVADLLEPTAPAQRLKPLFTVGVHDIPTLVEYQKPTSSDDQNGAVVEDTGAGWVACTTDSILAMKGDLWDMLITMPPPHAANAKEKTWPTIESRKGVPVRATQRDLRRFKHLQNNLSRYASSTGGTSPSTTILPATQNSTDITPDVATHGIKLGSRPNGVTACLSLSETEYETEKVVEPTTWAALAYNGFMWWASAGEQRGEEADESSRDSALFADLGLPLPSMTPSLAIADSVTSLGYGNEDEDQKARIELAIIAYFHRLTTQMLGLLADLVEGEGGDDEVDMEGEDEDRLLGRDREGDEESRNGPWAWVDSEALAGMGLDVWSEGDAEFVRELTPRYFARRAYVEGKGVEVCGLRVC